MNHCFNNLQSSEYIFTCQGEGQQRHENESSRWHSNTGKRKCYLKDSTKLFMHAQWTLLTFVLSIVFALTKDNTTTHAVIFFLIWLKVAIATIRSVPIQSGKCWPTAGLLSSENHSSNAGLCLRVSHRERGWKGHNNIAATLCVKIFYSTVSVTCYSCAGHGKERAARSSSSTFPTSLHVCLLRSTTGTAAQHNFLHRLPS